MKKKDLNSKRTFTNGLIVCVIFLLCSFQVFAQKTYISETKLKNSFPLVSGEKAAPLCISSKDYPGVKKVVEHLKTDISKVTGQQTRILTDEIEEDFVVIIGTVGKNPVIDQLIKEKKINAEDVIDKWDTYALQVVKKPLPGVKQALVIFGSNKRGTIYGMYDLSKQIGVSPWYWWADVPVQAKSEIYIKFGFYSPGEPKVKYRGIFLNDEAPALTNWAREIFGGFNHEFYEKVFELILRNKGNYLWPAMWVPSSFFEDDKENARLADEYGVIISTTHHEPMMRAHADWYSYGGGKWNYQSNKEKLHEFWRQGIERMGDYESVVTVGMRGDGDEAMSEETAVELLQNIISDQRKIIEDLTQKPAEETPQVWAVYKEVQDYYDKGMRVDDDILVLFCDDNWGNVQILPKKEDLNRKGGYGMYYHYDYVGGPVSYKWLNVTQIEKVWEQMNLAYQWGVDDLWIVNVGDLKPMELPISFWFDFAWNPEAISQKDLPNYYTNWAAQQFGTEYAQEIGEILALYTKYNSRRIPEALNTTTYNLQNYNEAERIVEEYNTLAEKAENVNNKLPEEYKSAYYQLVLYPVLACNTLNEMIVASAKNQLYANQGITLTNYYADKVEELFEKDAELTQTYHKEISDGKWNHMMSQPHIDFTSKRVKWYELPLNKMPAINRVHPAPNSGLRYSVESGVMPNREGFMHRKMQTFDPLNDQTFFIKLFNTGSAPLDYQIFSEESWINFSSTEGTINDEDKIRVSINWDEVPDTDTNGYVVISSGGRKYNIEVPIRMDLPECKGFIENNGVVSIEAGNFDKAVDSEKIKWITIPNLGRTGSSVTTSPAKAESQTLNSQTPYLEYTFSVFDSSDIELHTYLSPTLNYQKNEGLKFAVAIDNEEPQLVNINEFEIKPIWQYASWWEKIAMDHVRIKNTKHEGLAAGKHTLKVWMIDPGVVFQKFVIDVGGLKLSYLGPPESKYVRP